MAKKRRLTDLDRKRIVADYIDTGNYSETGRRFGVADNTVKRVVEECGDIAEQIEEKKRQNTEDVARFMETRREIVCEIIEKGLHVLNDENKLATATPAQITTAIGTLIDKWTQMQRMGDAGAVNVELGKAEEYSE